MRLLALKRKRMVSKVAGAGPCAGRSPLGSRPPPDDGAVGSRRRPLRRFSDRHAFAFNSAVTVDSFPMDWQNRKRLDHSPVDWLRDEPDYFITLCAKPRGLNHFCHASMGSAILDSVKHRNEKQIWFCHLVVLMPDHIHLMLSFPDLPSFSGVIGSWKHWLSRSPLCRLA